MLDDPNIESLERLIDGLEIPKDGNESRILVDVLLRGVGLSSQIRGGGYYTEALSYYMGLIYARLSRPEMAIPLLEQSNVPPASGGYLLFEDQVRDGQQLIEKCQEGRSRGMPSFLIASMVRSASATLTQTIAEVLDLPRVRISSGTWVVPRWLNMVSPGGAVLHDHFTGRAFNIDKLVSNGVKDIFVLIRDPRAAAASAVALLEKQNSSPLSNEERGALIIENVQHRLGVWLEDWIKASKADNGLNVRWILSKDVRFNINKVWGQLVDNLAPHYPALDAFRTRCMPLIKANFNKGDDDAWRQYVSHSDRQIIWGLISPTARKLLSLKV